MTIKCNFYSYVIVIIVETIIRYKKVMIAVVAVVMRKQDDSSDGIIIHLSSIGKSNITINRACTWLKAKIRDACRYLCLGIHAHIDIYLTY